MSIDVNSREAALWTANMKQRSAFDALSKAMCMPDGPSLAVQRHDPSWVAWKALCDAFAYGETGRTPAAQDEGKQP